MGVAGCRKHLDMHKAYVDFRYWLRRLLCARNNQKLDMLPPYPVTYDICGETG
jgi:hypothetical protein